MIIDTIIDINTVKILGVVFVSSSVSSHVLFISLTLLLNLRFDLQIN